MEKKSEVFNTKILSAVYEHIHFYVKILLLIGFKLNTLMHMRTYTNAESLLHIFCYSVTLFFITQQQTLLKSG